MLCTNCNANLPDDANFCHICGAKQEKKTFCSACGQELMPDARFCFYCGAAVGTAVASAPVVEVAIKNVVASASEKNSDVFAKDWLEKNSEVATRLGIEWISKFKGNYAIAIFLDGSTALVQRNAFDETQYEVVLRSLNYASYSVHSQKGDSVIEEECFGNGLTLMGMVVESSVYPLYIEDIVYQLTGRTVDTSMDGFTLCLVADYYGDILLSKFVDYRITVDVLKIINNDYYVMLDTSAYIRAHKAQMQKTSAPNDFDFDAEWGDSSNNQNVYVLCNADGKVVHSIYLATDSIAFRHGGLVFSVGNDDGGYSSSNSSVLNPTTGKMYIADKTHSFYTVSESSSGVGGDSKKYIIQASYIDSDESELVLIDSQDRVMAKLGRGRTDIEVLEKNTNIFVKSESGTKCNFFFIKQNNESYSMVSKQEFDELVVELSTVIEAAGSAFLVCTCYDETGAGKKRLYNSEFKIIAEVNRLKDKNTSSNDEFMFDFEDDWVTGENDDFGFIGIGNDIFSINNVENNLGIVNAEVVNLSTGNGFSVPKKQLVVEDGSDVFIEYDEDRDDWKYKFGSISAFGRPYFLVKDGTKCGLVDEYGRFIIPYSEDNLFITQRDYLPANTFYVGSIGSLRKVYDTNGTLVAQGRFEEGGKVNELRDNYEGCKIR